MSLSQSQSHQIYSLTKASEKKHLFAELHVERLVTVDQMPGAAGPVTIFCLVIKDAGSLQRPSSVEEAKTLVAVFREKQLYLIEIGCLDMDGKGDNSGFNAVGFDFGGVVRALRIFFDV